MHADSFHRLMKMLVDSGEVATIDEAIITFSGYGVCLTLGEDVAQDSGLQIMALTVINTAARSFQGNVHIVGDLSLTLNLPGFEGSTLASFVEWAGVNAACIPTEAWPEIRVGRCTGPICRTSLEPWAAGWSFGIGPAPASRHEVFAPACIAAASLAVSEAFSLLRSDNPYAGRRPLAMSLWSMKADAAQPPENVGSAVGGDLWVVGLGHLGQAYCWTLSMMKRSSFTRLVLQDTDIITQSTLTTSVLSSPNDIGSKKTRTVAYWMEARGFDTRIVERRFDANTRLAAGEPTTALFGVDNPSARRVCEGAGFSLVLDAGLGSGHRDFRALRVRGFPGASSASIVWASDDLGAMPQLAPAYLELLQSGRDPCGITTLATRSVGAPFVGCYAAAILLAELVRRQAGALAHNVIDVSLRAPDRLEVA
ncbi:UNVERIFIED_ORG: ThiF family adenylyltransferase [Shinella sp. XGS7]|nr:ThiF family adenylyltransferase [Shinella sp. XGS7]